MNRNESLSDLWLARFASGHRPRATLIEEAHPNPPTVARIPISCRCCAINNDCWDQGITVYGLVSPAIFPALLCIH